MQDTRAKEVQRGLFKQWGDFGQPLASRNCSDVMTKIYGADFNATDAEHVAAWLGMPCDFKPPPPPDPSCGPPPARLLSAAVPIVKARCDD